MALTASKSHQNEITYINAVMNPCPRGTERKTGWSNVGDEEKGFASRNWDHYEQKTSTKKYKDDMLVNESTKM